MKNVLLWNRVFHIPMGCRVEQEGSSYLLRGPRGDRRIVRGVVLGLPRIIAEKYIQELTDEVREL